jgi:hypothetical protein
MTFGVGACAMTILADLALGMLWRVEFGPVPHGRG